MITDDGLNSLAIFLGSLAMLLIVLYHFLEVNAVEDDGKAATNETMGAAVKPSTTPNKMNLKI